MRICRIILTGLTALALLPFASILLTALLAGVLGCEVSDLGPEPCQVFGADAGGLLSGLLTLGGMVQLTIPILMSLLFCWLIVEALAFGRRRRKTRRMAKRSAMQSSAA